MPKSPFVSVLVSAYGESPYLGEALASVIGQAEDPRSLEVVLLTDRHRSLDAIGGASTERDPPVREVLAQEPGKGAFFARGLQSCQGEVVSFLNDDDIWLPGKLTAVKRWMGSSPAVGLHRGGVRFYDGQPTSPPGWHRLSTRSGGKPVRIQRGRKGWPADLGRYAMGFNDSAISARREVLEPALPYLARIRASEDTFFLYAALASSGEMIYDPSPSVLYRTTPPPGPSSPPTSSSDPWSELHREFQLRVETYRVIRDAVSALAPDRAEVLAMADRGVALYELLSTLTTPDSSRARIARRAWELLPSWRIYGPSMNLGLIATATLSLASSRIARQLLLRAGLGWPLPPGPA